MNNPLFGRLKGVLVRFYPIPEAFLGYLIGIVFAVLTIEAPLLPYEPLPLRDALTDALSAELPFLLAAALLAWLRPIRLIGAVLVGLRAATFGFGAVCFLFDYPSLGYAFYVILSVLQTALLACPVRYASECFSAGKRYDRHTVCEYLLRWLFYSGCALLLLPLKYCFGF